MKKITVGIDVGGTNIEIGLVDSLGHIIIKDNIQTKTLTKNRKKLIDAVIKSMLNLLYTANIKKQNISGICFGLPGLINPKAGIVNFLPNIPGWKNVPLKQIVQKITGIKTFIDNDVNLITLGEWKYGAGKGYNNLMCMTLGTGVGAGLIFDGRLYRGEGYVAGELGHMPLNEKGPKCNCGGYGCFERYVGNITLTEKASKIFKSKKITLEDVSYLAQKGNSRAIEFLDDMSVHIGNGLVGVVNLLNPRLIIIGGGISKSYKLINNRIKKVIKERSMKTQGNMVKITRAKLGSDAGLIGAQVLVDNRELI